MRYVQCVSGLVFAAFCSTPVWAQDWSAGESDSLLAPPRQWITTLGHGAPEDGAKLPDSITTVTRRELDLSEYQNLQQSIRRAPSIGGASAEGVPSWWNPGVSIRGLGGPRVAVVSQGVAQSMQGLESGDGGNLSLYDPFSVERIEVIRGSQVARFGGGAFGGIVSVIPRAPTERDTFGVTVGGRSAFDGAVNAMRHSGLIDLGGEDVGILAGGSSVGSETPVTPADDAADEGSYRTGSGWLNSRVRVSGGTTVYLRGDLNHNSDILAARRTAEGGVGGRQRELQFPRYQRSLLSAELLSHDLSTALESFRSTVAWQQFSRRTQLTLTPSNIPTEQPLTDDTVDTIGWSTATTLPVSKGHITVGYELGYDDSTLESRSDEAPAGSSARLDASQYRSALSAQGRFPLGSFEISPGARLEYITADDRQSDDVRHDIGTNGSLAASYSWSDTRTAYLSLSSGFRAPTLGERFYSGELVGTLDGTRLIGDAGLGGERGNAVELGVKQMTYHYSYAVAGFYNRISNYIGMETVPSVRSAVASRDLAYTNISSVSLAGFELEGSYRLIEELELFANFAQTFSSAAERVDLPALSANYGVRYVQELCDCTALKQLTATLYARSIGSSSDRTEAAVAEPFPSSQSFTTLSLESALEFAPLSVGELTLLTGVRNLTNARHREPFYNQLQPGLTGYVALELRY